MKSATFKTPLSQMASQIAINITHTQPNYCTSSPEYQDEAPSRDCLPVCANFNGKFCNSRTKGIPKSLSFS